MKKATSVLLILVLFMSMLGSSPVSFAAEEDTPYSGGSGTEDDPYLISSSEDIKELYFNIENDPTLYSKKIHYKLTNDLTVDHMLSPLYIDNFIGPNSFIETKHKIITSFPWDYDDSGNYFEPDDRGTRLSDVVSEMGPLTVLADHTVYSETMSWLPDIESVKHICTVRNFDEYVSIAGCGGFDNWSYGSKIEGYLTVYRQFFYRNASFTGIFDGNGHTLTVGSAKYLFGTVENGAVIKNLNIKADEGSLAYSIDETCTVENCSFNIDESTQITYLHSQHYDYYILELYGPEDERVYCDNYTTVSGFVVYPNNIFIDCISYGKDGMNFYPGNESCKQYRCVDLSGKHFETDSEEYYTLEECTAAKGDPSAYAGFDFENVWIMKDGLPYLRTALKRGTGDLDVNGAVNSIDTNLLRRYLSGSILNPEFIHPDGADMDNNGELNAVDSALLRRMLVG